MRRLALALVLGSCAPASRVAPRPAGLVSAPSLLDQRYAITTRVHTAAPQVAPGLEALGPVHRFSATATVRCFGAGATRRGSTVICGVESLALEASRVPSMGPQTVTAALERHWADAMVSLSVGTDGRIQSVEADFPAGEPSNAGDDALARLLFRGFDAPVPPNPYADGWTWRAAAGLTPGAPTAPLLQSTVTLRAGPRTVVESRPQATRDAPLLQVRHVHDATVGWVVSGKSAWTAQRNGLEAAVVWSRFEPAGEGG